MIFIFTSLLIQSCEKKKLTNFKSIDQIQKEKGIPVKEMIIQSQELKLTAGYICTLEGSNQVTVSSMVGDKVEKCYAKTGMYVTANKVLIEFPAKNTSVKYESIKQSYENQKKLYEQTLVLLKKGETSQQNFDLTETQYLAAKKNYESIKQMLFVESPINGVVLEKFVDDGTKVKVGDKLFTIAQTEKLKAVFWVSEQEYQNIKLETPLEISIKEKKYIGKIIEIASTPDEIRNAYKITTEFTNPKNELKVGMTAEIKFEYYYNPNAILIPSNSILVRGEKKFVFLTDGNLAYEKEIQIGKSKDENVEVILGLKNGDRLICQGIGVLKNGAKISITPY